MSKRHYVYLHRKATDGAVFYVGKGKDRRAWGRSGRNRWWHHVAAKHGFTVTILRGDLSEPCALALERITISRIGISLLANIVDGGGGTQGWKHSAETKRRIGAFHKGRKLTDKMREALDRNRGRPLTPEHRAKLSLAKIGKKRGPLSAETRAKISRSHIGIRPTEETLRKLRDAKIGKAVGKSNPSYDHTIRTFSHPTLGEFTGTRAEFIAAFGLGGSCVSAVIKGRQQTVKGWRKI